MGESAFWGGVEYRGSAVRPTLGRRKGGFPQPSPHSHSLFPSGLLRSSLWACGERGFQLN